VRLVQQSHSDASRQRYMQFMKKSPCPECRRGERLSPEGRFVTVDGMRLPQITVKTIDALIDWVRHLPSALSARNAMVASQIIQELTTQLQSLIDLGLHYLTIDRSAPTLSGGEAQRLRLSGQLTANMTGMLYVLDEPTIGLHARDHEALVDTLRKLRDFGNTIVVVEHDAIFMREADYIIDLGPAAGEHGGEVVVAGTPADVMKHATQSMPGKYLSGMLRVNDEMPLTREELSESQVQRNCITIVGAMVHNLKNVNVSFPIGRLTCVTGVSGSGKSSLVSNCLSPAIERMLQTGCLPPLLCKNVSGHIQLSTESSTSPKRRLEERIRPCQ
jgi:excinuclease ABC subunit A